MVSFSWQAWERGGTWGCWTRALTPACLLSQLTNAGDDVVVFYNDKASLAHLLDMMKAARDGVEDHSPLMYHISLVDLLAACAEGKNVYTEIKCTSLLPLEDVVTVVTHEDCITEVCGSGWEKAVVWSCGGESLAGPVDTALLCPLPRLKWLM